MSGDPFQKMLTGGHPNSLGLETLAPLMTSSQHQQAEAVLKRNLAHHRDWIVLHQTMKTLGAWAKQDAELKAWLLLHLERLSQDGRKSIAKTAVKTLNSLALTL